MMDVDEVRRRCSPIPSAGPSITEEEVQLVTQALRHGWYENRNIHIDQFVEEFSSYIDKKYCLPTSHCTAAIHLALLALDLGPRDEVIVPDITWVASAAPVHYVGAQIVFCDIDPNSLCMSPQALERAITKNTKAAIAVGLAGNVPEMDKILTIADHHNIHVIEDAAESIGASYKGKKAGTFGDVSVFSFNATKILTAGQGGMLATDDENLYRRVKRLAHHGIDRDPGSRYYWSNEIGYNYNWTNIQAALALAQLRRIDELVEIKRRIHDWYRQGLESVEGIHLNTEPPDVRSTFWLNTVYIDSEYGMKKEEIKQKLQVFGIDARPFFYPISSMPPYVQYCACKNMDEENPVSYELSPNIICLPSAFCHTKDDIAYVCDSLRKVLA